MSDPVSLSDWKAAHELGYRCILEFDSDDREGMPGEFVRGYEAGILEGRLGGILRDGPRPERWSGTYHATNREMLRRIAAACGYAVAIEESSDPFWVFATFTKESE